MQGKSLLQSKQSDWQTDNILYLLIAIWGINYIKYSSIEVNRLKTIQDENYIRQ